MLIDKPPGNPRFFRLSAEKLRSSLRVFRKSAVRIHSYSSKPSDAGNSWDLELEIQLFFNFRVRGFFFSWILILESPRGAVVFKLGRKLSVEASLAWSTFSLFE